MNIPEDAIANLVDKADNFLALTQNSFMPPLTLIAALTHGLNEIRKELYDLHIRSGGEDVWD
jgi:hypothetical protein